MAKYRRREVVEAEQFFRDKRPWPKGVTPEDDGVPIVHLGNIAFVPCDGDWIRWSDRGVLLEPLSNERFRQRYAPDEPATPEADHGEG